MLIVESFAWVQGAGGGGSGADAGERGVSFKVMVVKVGVKTDLGGSFYATCFLMQRVSSPVPGSAVKFRRGRSFA